MKKVSLLLSFSVFVFLISCEKEQNLDVSANQQIDLEPTRVIFADWDEFENTLNDLEASNSEDFIMNWIFEKGHESLYIQDFEEETISDIEKLTNGLLAVFNKNFEFQVGKEIISYNKDSFFSQMNNLNAKKKIGQIRNYDVPMGNEIIKSEGTEKTTIWSNGGYAALQDKIFPKTAYQDCYSGYSSGSSSRKWKFRQMLKAVAYDIGVVYNHVLYLECKLYINKSVGSNSYRYAESRRNYTYNFSGYANIGNSGNTSFSFNNFQRNCVGGSSTASKWNRLLLWQKNYYYNGTINVYGSGTVTHKLNGNGASGTWNNSFVW